MPKKSILEAIQEEIIVADGAAGTRFYEKGIPLHTCYEHLNLTHPKVVQEMHREYVLAGARLIETNTFGANRTKLKEFDLEKELENINRRGVQIARKAAGLEVFVAGSIGPLLRKPSGEVIVSNEQTKAFFREQAKYLIDEGVDLILLETFPNQQQIVAAITAVREISKDIPIIAQMAYAGPTKTVGGDPLDKVVVACEEAGANIIGANCGQMGPYHIMHVVRNITQNTELPVSALPNAGFPEYHEGRIVYRSTPEYLGDCAKSLVEQGVRIVGGCCGTGPEHINAIARRVSGMKPTLAIRPSPAGVLEPVSAPVSEERQDLNVLKNLGVKPVITVELTTPRTLDIDKILLGCKIFARLQVDGINFAENPLGRMCMSTVAISHILQSRFNVPAIAHITCRDRNIIGLQSELMGASVLGISSIMAITGDPASVGDFPWARSVFDVNSYGLIELINKMNLGMNYSNQPLGRKTNFSIGVAFNASRERYDNEIKRLKRKLDAGADYAQTQPMYDLDKIKEMYEKTAPVKCPVLLGLLPVVSSRNAEFLHNEFPGIQIPNALREKLRNAGSKEDEQKISLDHVLSIVEETKSYVPGYYIITQFNNFRLPRLVVEAIQS